jgi:voltage-gated potassium channel
VPISTQPERRRWAALHRLEERLELPMVVLGFVWMALLVVELVAGLTPLLSAMGLVVWAVFVADFLLRLWLAPSPGGYLKRNWLAAVSLAIPALRVFRILRALRAVRALQAARGTRLVRLVATMNRGMKVLRSTFGRRGAAYVAALTAVVIVLGAAGMLALEGGEGVISGFPDSLWWTTVTVVTLGMEPAPVTAEGKVLSVLLALYGLGIVGWVTAVITSFLVGREIGEPQPPELDVLVEEVAELRREINLLRRQGREVNGEE